MIDQFNNFDSFQQNLFICIAIYMLKCKIRKQKCIAFHLQLDFDESQLGVKAKVKVKESY